MKSKYAPVREISYWEHYNIYGGIVPPSNIQPIWEPHLLSLMETLEERHRGDVFLIFTRGVYLVDGTYDKFNCKVYSYWKVHNILVDIQEVDITNKGEMNITYSSVAPILKDSTPHPRMKSKLSERDFVICNHGLMRHIAYQCKSDPETILEYINFLNL